MVKSSTGSPSIGSPRAINSSGSEFLTHDKLTFELANRWRLNNNLTDSKGTNDGSNNGGTFDQTSKEGIYAWRSDGEQTFTINQITLDSPFTLSYWIRIKNFTSGYAIHLGTTGETDNRISIDSGNTVIKFVEDDGTSHNFNVVWSTATWYFLTFVYDGSTLTFYRGNSQVGSASVSNIEFIWDKVGYGYTTGFSGDVILDDIYRQRKAISSSEQSTLYNSY